MYYYRGTCFSTLISDTTVQHVLSVHRSTGTFHIHDNYNGLRVADTDMPYIKIKLVRHVPHVYEVPEEVYTEYSGQRLGYWADF